MHACGVCAVRMLRSVPSVHVISPTDGPSLAALAMRAINIKSKRTELHKSTVLFGSENINKIWPAPIDMSVAQKLRMRNDFEKLSKTIGSLLSVHRFFGKVGQTDGHLK